MEVKLTELVLEYASKFAQERLAQKDLAALLPEIVGRHLEPI